MMMSFSRTTLSVLLGVVTLLSSSITAQVAPVSRSTVYNVATGTAPAPVTFTPRTDIPLVTADDAVDSAIPIGFPFVFYNYSYTTVNLGTNGNIQFQTASTSLSPTTFGVNYASLSPMIAFSHSDMYPTQVGSRSFGIIGTAPSRQFVYRWSYVGYCCTNNPNEGLSMDVIFTETSNTIKIRYYSTLASTRYVSMGIQNAENGAYDYISIINYQLFNETLAAGLINAEYTFTPIVAFTNPRTYDPTAPQTSTSAVYDATVTVGTPPLESLVLPNTIPTRDNAVTQVSIGFPFVFYGVQYSNMYVSDNGNLQFSTASPAQYPYSWGGSNVNLAPFIAYFYADIYNAPTTSRVYGTVGTVGSRRFVLRLTNVYLQTYISSQPLSCDVILYEGSNNIEFRYYAVPVMDQSTYYYADIGIQNSLSSQGTYDYVSVLNYQNINSGIASMLVNKTYVFTPRTPFTNPVVYAGPTAPVPVTSGSTMYTCGAAVQAPGLATFTPQGTLPAGDSNVVAVRLGFNFTFYNVNYDAIYVSDNGNIQFQTYSTSAYPYTLGSSSNSALSPFIAFAYSDMMPGAGSRSYATLGTAPNRYWILRLTNVAFQSWITDSTSTLSMDVLLHEGGNIEFRYYSVPSFTSPSYYMDIGIQNASVASRWDNIAIVNYRNLDAILATGLTNKAYTISPITPFTNPVYYPGAQPPVPVNAASTMYSAGSSVAAPPAPTFTPTGTLPATDNGVDRISLGFRFTFYNISYDTVYIGGNGNIQFQTGATNQYPYSWGSSNLALSPFIGFFYADMVPSTSTAVRSYATLGQPGSRYFILRLVAVPMQSYIAPATSTLTMDVILYEGTNEIKFNYYQVPSFTSTSYYCNIGVQNAAVNNVYDYVSIVNYQNINAIVSNTLVGRSYTISPRAPFTNPAIFDTTIMPQSSSSMYTATYSQGSLPAPISFTPGTPPLPNTDNDATLVSIGFDFVFMNKSYSGVWIGANGQLQFETAQTSQYPYAFGSNSGLTPAIYFFYADLLPTTSTSSRTYGIAGTAPNRKFVVRYRDVAMQSYISTERLSCDVILSEGTNAIELRFYNVPTFLSSSYYATIGIEGKTPPVDWISIVNYKSVTTVIREGLNQTNYVFTPTVPFTNSPRFVPIAPRPFTSAGSSYSIVSRSTVPERVTFTPMNPPLQVANDVVNRINLPFNFTFYNTRHSQLWVSSNGNIQFRTGSLSTTASPFTGTGNTAMWPAIFSFFSDLLPVSASSRTYGIIGNPGQRQFILRYDSVPYQISTGVAGISCDTILYEGTNEVELRYYTVSPSPTTYQYVTVGMASALGDYVSIINGVTLGGAEALGLAGTSYLITPTSLVLNPPYYEMPPLRIVDYSVWYNSVVVPNPTTRAVFNPVTNPALPAADDSVTTIPIGFNFRFYNRSYSTVTVSTNGNLQFETASTTLSPGSFGSGNTALTPFIAFWHADLYPGASNMRSYGLTGNTPLRQFIVRYTNVSYCCSIIPGEGLDIDVVLFETTNNIELRYYQIPSGSRAITAGVENSRSAQNTVDYVSIFNNVAIDGISAAQLVDSTIRIFPSNDSIPVDPVVPVNPQYAPQPSVGTSTIYNATVRVSPAAVTLPTFTTLPSTDDGIDLNIPLGFSFSFYNISYTSVNIAGNGNLQFETSGTSRFPDPFGSGDDSLTPWIAFAHSDLYSPANSRVYATIGTAGSRQFVLRLVGVGYCCTAVTPGWTIDIILFEGTNQIELRYYSALAGSSYQVAIGIENRPRNGVYDFIAILQNQYLSNTVADTLRGISYLFTPIRPFTPGAVRTYEIEVVHNGRDYNVDISQGPSWAVVSDMNNLRGCDDCIDYTPLPFEFVFFNQSYNSVNISSNGNIQFVTGSTAYTNALFTTSVPTYISPIIANFFADMWPGNLGQRATFVTGTAPNRRFTVRLTDVGYCCSYTAGQGLSMDVVLHETTNIIDMIFYRLPPLSSYSTVEIGLQSAASGNQWVYVWNDRIFDSNYITTFTGKQIRFSPVSLGPPPIPNPPIVYSSRSYLVDITQAPALPTRTGLINLPTGDDRVDTVELTFPFVFYNHSFDEIVMSSNGNLQFSTAGTDYSNQLFGTGTSPTWITPIIAYFFTDMYHMNLGQRSYMITGTAPNRQFIFRATDLYYCCSAPAGQGLTAEVILQETSNTITMNYYNIPIPMYTNGVEIGLENSGTRDWVYVWNDVAFNTTSAALFNGKSIRYTPQNQGAGTRPEPMTFTTTYNSHRNYRVDIGTAPTYITNTNMNLLEGTDDSIAYIPLPFPFVFYNRAYTSINSSSNGNIQFTTASTAWSVSLFNPTPAPLLTPIIAHFFSDLYPTTRGQRGWFVTGTAPNRQFVLRYVDVWYCCQEYAAGQGLLMDVILSEATNTIDLNYYRVPVDGYHLVEIGIQNSGEANEWVYVWNDVAFNSTAASSLRNKNIRFTPIPYSSSTGAPGPMSSSGRSSSAASSSAAVSSSAQPSSSSSPQVSSSSSSANVIASSTGRSSSSANVVPSSSSARPSSSSTNVGVPSSSSSANVVVASSSTADAGQTATTSSTGSVAEPSSSTAVFFDDSAKSSNSLSGGAIAGIVIGVIVGVLILALFCFFALVGYRRDGQKFQTHTDASDEPSKVTDDDTHSEEPVEGGEVEMETV